jgi:polysaccharide export outer membrane protein
MAQSKNFMALLAWVVVLSGLLGCNPTYPPLQTTTGGPEPTPLYVIGPGDSLTIDVWRNPEVSVSTSVRSDGTITTPLVEDLPATGKTTTELARELEELLADYIRDPIVTVIAGGGNGPFSRQIRVVGEANAPQSLSYIEDMTLLDLMIQVGGVSDFADANKTSLIRWVNGEQKMFTVRIDDLLKKADMTANVDIYPGDIIVVPESFF